MHSPPYVCLSICISLRVYVPSCAFLSVSIFISSVRMTLHVHLPLHVIPPVCISPPCVCLLHVYVPSDFMFPPCGAPSVRMFLCLVVPSCVSCLYEYFPPCVCNSVCMFVRCVFPFMCMYLRVNSSEKGLVRQVSRVHKLTSVPTLVWSLGCVQRGPEAYVCAHIRGAICGVQGARLCTR